MPSSNKTPFLGLNTWVGADKPKMADFNGDNSRIDSALMAHVQNNSLHVTPAEKQMAASPYAVGQYVGDGAVTRTVTLDFEPSFGFLFPRDKVPWYTQLASQAYNLPGGFFSKLGSTAGVTLTGNQLQVISALGVSPDYLKPEMNLAGVTYIYVAFR